MSGDDQAHNAPLADDAASETNSLTITLSHRKNKFDFQFAEDATVVELMDEIAASLDIPVTNQKIIVPKGPLLKAPLNNPEMSLHELTGKTLMLMGSGAAEVKAVEDMTKRVALRNEARMLHRHSKTGNFGARKSSRSAAESSPYTFMQVRCLQGLPHPKRSQKLLEKLKADPGIVAAMRKHKFTVSLLTEMEPLSNTQSSHEGTSRILGLNRNQGEVIELRLRTDAYDGYRDYKTIRKTLCHELAHNVHGPHDRNFWDLCHQIEREVQAADWKSGGHTIGEASRYTISGQDDEEEEEEHFDDGGWTGGEFVLGGINAATNDGLSRREVLALAAIKRRRLENEAEWKTMDSATDKKLNKPKPGDDGLS